MIEMYIIYPCKFKFIGWFPEEEWVCRDSATTVSTSDSDGASSRSLDKVTGVNLCPKYDIFAPPGPPPISKMIFSAFFVHNTNSFKYFFMKIDMNTIHCIPN